MSYTQRFPSITMTGYHSAGWTSQQANGYYQYGANGDLTHLAGSHNLKGGVEYRRIGVTANSPGASTGTYGFTGTFTGQPLADALLGYPATASIPLNTPVNGFVNYFAAYAQDDWHLNKLTLNYAIRVEHESGLQEVNNDITVNFAQTTVNPLNNQVTVTDPLTGLPRTLMGGLIYAGVNGAPTAQGNQPALKPAPRMGAVYSFNDKTVLRGGWGLYWVPWNYGAAGTTTWGQIGYSATTTDVQTTPDRHRRRRHVHRPEQGRAPRAAVLR
jgi:hypothetical protein